ncbi:MAG: hypothetical protein E6J47_07425 [Chloroflexi bacterium]|nr:MAG: hypothetical protein E6J47_07425 [Chloroflexota bacterium]
MPKSRPCGRDRPLAHRGAGGARRAGTARAHPQPADRASRAPGLRALLVRQARDLAKLGQLYLEGGAWAGGRVVSEEWVRESTQAWIPSDPGSHYGFQWWLHGLAAGSPPNDVTTAGGTAASTCSWLRALASWW